MLRLSVPASFVSKGKGYRFVKSSSKYLKLEKHTILVSQKVDFSGLNPHASWPCKVLPKQSMKCNM